MLPHKVTNNMPVVFYHTLFSVADPGFAIGGHGPRRGGVDSREGYVLKFLYVKMKESGPSGGCALGNPL